MTKEVAEKIAKGITDKIECNTVDIDDWAEFWGFTREEYEEFLDVAIKALEQQPCEDAISRKAVRKLICQNNDKYGYSDRFHEFTERFLQLPSVKQQPKTGHWILYHPLQADDPGAYRCSVCGYGDWGLDPEIDKFCFNCGARMTESEKEE